MSPALEQETKDRLVEKLGDLQERFSELESKMADPEIVQDSARYPKLAREYGALSKFAEKYEKLQDLRQRKEEAVELKEEADGDPEMKELAEQEIEECTEEIDRVFDNVLDLFLEDEGEGDRNVILEIRAGAGGEEGALFAADLFRMYTRYAEKQGWKVEQLSMSESDMGGLKEVVVSIKGDGVWRRMRYESGGHRVQRVPVTESQGRIHTSLATVAVLPEARDVDVKINPEDLDISFMSSSGPGGQHVNRAASCVRIVHEPTGVTVRCQDEKSQHRNRKKAMQILRARLQERIEREQREKRDELRKNQVGSGDRSERVRTYNFPQDRITDHRIGLDVFGVENVLMGDCDELFNALAEHDRQERIKAFAES